MPTPPKSSRLKRWLKRLLKITAFVYLGLAIVLYFLQTWMIFPGASTQGKTEARVKPDADQQLVALTTSTGDRTFLLFSPALNADGSPRADAAHRPTLLYFYGNAMTISSSDEDLYKFRRLGVNVAIPEFVG